MGDPFMDGCSKHHIEVAMVVGVAHWQNGVVERRIQTVERTYGKMLSEAEATLFCHVNQAARLVLAVCQVKNYFGKSGGASPQQWMIGRPRP
eukprot:9717245-Lingulodinium_polyedra.AAC.1